VEAFVEAAALELFPELPGVQPDPRGVEGGFIEAVELEEA
jgi:hypothetical protein